MEITINIKAVGQRHGTVGWLKTQLETGAIILRESNRCYIPIWSEYYRPGGIMTHGLVIADKNGNSAVIAYRVPDDDYYYGVRAALDPDSEFSHWNLLLTDAALTALESICQKWIDMQEEDTAEEITVTINKEE